MGRPSGTKDHMRTSKEKEENILEYLNGGIRYKTIARKHGISFRYFSRLHK